MPPSHFTNESFPDFLAALTVYWPRLLASIVGGGIIGAENQVYGKPAGLRTSLLVSIACCSITIVSIETAYLFNGSPDRITAQILTGIGFIGGGVILRERGKIYGITTAASILVSAAIGIAAGTGFIFSSIAVALLAFIVLLGLRPVDYVIDKSKFIRRVREADRAESLKRLRARRPKNVSE
jgi:putative Mg2+ transporter-C (MgtC) family protein